MKPRALTLILLASAALPAFAQQASEGGGSSADDISRKLADPGAALISVPFQYNYQGSAGPGSNYDNQTLKVQPVIPFVGDKGKFILRPILPFVSNEFPQDKSGLGDVFVQGYYIPSHPGQARSTEFGFGPALMLDTASHDSLGTGKYSIGPAFIAVHKTKKWTIGALANHLWSFAGDDDRDDVSVTNVQPFITRSLANGWSAGFTSETSYNWEAGSGNEWTVPIGGTISKVTHFGHMPVSIGVGGFYNVDRPEYASRWTARLMITLVFPE
ncbi:hypothetical protein ACFOLC_04915 [Lysobacter cavernae]|uniref:Transporter n=1 Tax=Lysobacter cavernae TaxID=1685901 RepID=A0ABV7RL29_9GAMM